MGQKLNAVVFMALVVAASAWRGIPAATPARTNAVDGRMLYQRDCATCHGSDASGSFLGPDISTVGLASIDFQVTTGRMPLLGNDPTRRADPNYTASQIDDLLTYVSGIVSGPPVPKVDPRADVSRGQQLYQLNCAACHQAAGAGGVLAYDTQVPSLTGSTATQVVEAMRTGPGQMPVFNERFSDQEASEIAAYVRYLHDPRDRGGLSLGHFGPVPEGLVALALGLGGAIALTRWLGTREGVGRSTKS